MALNVITWLSVVLSVLQLFLWLAVSGSLKYCVSTETQETISQLQFEELLFVCLLVFSLIWNFISLGFDCIKNCLTYQFSFFY